MDVRIQERHEQIADTRTKLAEKRRDRVAKRPDPSS
jgi:hypothetical protein